MGRIGLSVLLGFLIGLERQITGHPAGIRINVLISMGACLFLMFPLMSGSDEVYRIASYIVSGVGFLSVYCPVPAAVFLRLPQRLF